MNYKFQGAPVPSKFELEVMKIIDTSVGHVDLIFFYEDIFLEQANPRAKKNEKFGLAHVATFPIAVQCLQFILVVAQTYNPTQRKCIDSSGNDIIDLSLEMIRFPLNEPPFPNLKIKTKVEALAQFQVDVEGNKTYINKRWLKTKNNSTRKIPPKPKRSNFS